MAGHTQFGSRAVVLVTLLLSSKWLALPWRQHEGGSTSTLPLTRLLRPSPFLTCGEHDNTILLYHLRR